MYRGASIEGDNWLPKLINFLGSTGNHVWIKGNNELEVYQGFIILCLIGFKTYAAMLAFQCIQVPLYSQLEEKTPYRQNHRQAGEQPSYKICCICFSLHNPRPLLSSSSSSSPILKLRHWYKRSRIIFNLFLKHTCCAFIKTQYQSSTSTGHCASQVMNHQSW